ncbi:nudix hydrolase 26, chloroplastic-like isoform X2 [Andrographis paniculata]|uniref:nudix hydrolase 26, chloroplastic-like isoform X2 n=1 Tax=Andrographis paniculata TaxID=175694 RepID=UPI0021E70E19|nr:nudix hydrolase 26, chloroplastic-like isoform X2 [Andrographis paniculata]
MALCRMLIHVSPPLQRILKATATLPDTTPRLHVIYSQSSSSSMENPPEGYRRNVGICLVNTSKQVFAASRLDIPDAWQMPQGGIDENEDPKNAALRELKEETGVTSADIIAEAPFWLTYDFPLDVREKLKVQWGSDWKGQAQKWMKRSISWVMGLKKLSSEAGRGFHPKK